MALDRVAPSYVYRATCRRVVDGDTFVADVDLGFRVTVAVTVRIHGVDAYEHDAPGGTEATDYLTAVLDGGTPRPDALLIRSYKDQQSFARWVCDVWLDDDQTPNVADMIIANGHGVAYLPNG